MSPTVRVTTGEPWVDELVPLVRSFLEQDALDLLIDGERIRGYRSPDARSVWIRDYSDMLRGFRYFEPDVKSVVDHFAATQAANGRIFDYVTTFPEKLPSERENWTKYVRVPVEADVEYRFVKAAWLAWQATGDDAWIASLLPSLEKALGYILRHPWRFDPGTGLIKRAYTIDTWDFAYSAGKHEWLQFQIDDDTFWGFAHGDQSGYFEAFRILARLHQRFTGAPAAREWTERAERLREASNRICFNGRFYTHFAKLTPVVVPGVDEARQLSLSNPMNINRCLATHEMACSILEEYQERRRTTGAFAEWFSIDPPFPDGVFGDEKLVGGAYVNGGIMPLVGGELARAAFEHGFEAYGVDILRRYHELVSLRGETYLWYFPDGTAADVSTSTSPDAQPTDGWGSSAMLWALLTGLAGIEDQEACLRKVRLSPRWAAAGLARATVDLGYAASGAALGYDYAFEDDVLRLHVRAEHTAVAFHVLLPTGCAAVSVARSPERLAFSNGLVEQSPYVDFASEVRGSATFEIRVKRDG